MKKYLLMIFLFIASNYVSAQFTQKIKADSVRIYNDNCNAELILENGTKNIKGFLYNKGNGRTEFRAAMIKLNDSSYVFGGDTLKIKPVFNGLTAGSVLFYSGTMITQDNSHLYWDTVSKTLTVTNLVVSNGITAATIAGTLTTAAQPNITSVGVLQSLSINGTITAGTFSGSGAGIIGMGSVTAFSAISTNANIAVTVSSGTTTPRLSITANPNPTFSSTTTTGQASNMNMTTINLDVNNRLEVTTLRVNSSATITGPFADHVGAGGRTTIYDGVSGSDTYAIDINNSTGTNSYYSISIQGSAAGLPDGNTRAGINHTGDGQLANQLDFSYSLDRTVRTVISSAGTFDIFRALDRAGNPKGVNNLTGDFYIYADATAGNSLSAKYTLTSNSNGTSDATLTEIAKTPRGSNPVIKYDIANDGVGGGIKLTAQTNIACTIYVRYVGLAY